MISSQIYSLQKVSNMYWSLNSITKPLIKFEYDTIVIFLRRGSRSCGRRISRCCWIWFCFLVRAIRISRRSRSLQAIHGA